MALLKVCLSSPDLQAKIDVLFPQTSTHYALKMFLYRLKKALHK